ncbi:hypothetical protein ACIBAG_14215 [Streptomyces sp. NPDC051243]|uniref:hypothetical protein n=1 Tax=Streptomyces sp. NPDC051243 TaxID=3365646 RepID=UPI0037AADB0A
MDPSVVAAVVGAGAALSGAFVASLAGRRTARLRHGQPLDEPSRSELRRSFSRLLREDLIVQFRPEVSAVRDPLLASTDASVPRGRRRR